MLRFLAIALLLTGCGLLKKKAAHPSADSRVGELRSLYAAKLQEHQGWPSVTDCDSTLWAGEARAAGVETVKLVDAEASPGVVWRRPTSEGNCYPKGAASSVSRDMLLGYMYGEWTAGDLPALERLRNYGSSHFWVMGEGEKTRTLLTLDGVGMLERAIHQLGGPKGSFEAIPTLCLPVMNDYEEHLQVVSALFDEDVTGTLSEECVKALSILHGKHPGDALFAAASGVQSGDLGPAFSLLLDPGYQPPSYVRGAPTYGWVHWLYAAHTVLKRYPGE